MVGSTAHGAAEGGAAAGGAGATAAGNRWTARIEEDPDHSNRYVERFRTMAADGVDLHGEARFVDAMVGRGARILDAGCGPGRVGGRLAELGHDVRSSHAGSHQLASPISFIVAGTNTIRTIVASTKIAVARPSPIILTPDRRRARTRANTRS
jgi:SAM-dependent methyltransferase